MKQQRTTPNTISQNIKNKAMRKECSVEDVWFKRGEEFKVDVNDGNTKIWGVKFTMGICSFIERRKNNGGKVNIYMLGSGCIWF